MSYQELAAYRPEDGVRNLISLSRERMDFYALQIALLNEALTVIVHEQAQIIEFYRAQVEQERLTVDRFSVFLAGGQMVHASPSSDIGYERPDPDQLSLPSVAASTPVSTLPNFIGEMSITAEEVGALLELRKNLASAASDQKSEILKTFSGAKDATRRESIEKALPIPQSYVSVVEYGPDEQLPPEAIPGHMTREPRAAEELTASRDMLFNAKV